MYRDTRQIFAEFNRYAGRVPNESPNESKTKNLNNQFVTHRLQN